jgi:hypothetical protein
MAGSRGRDERRRAGSSASEGSSSYSPSAERRPVLSRLDAKGLRAGGPLRWALSGAVADATVAGAAAEGVSRKSGGACGGGNGSELDIPGLNCEGSLRPETRVKPRSEFAGEPIDEAVDARLR